MSHSKYHIHRPSEAIIQETLKSATLDEFRVVWDLVHGYVYTAPKSSNILYGVDLGVYTKDTPVKTIQQALNRVESPVHQLIQNQEHTHQDYLYYLAKRGVLPLDDLKDVSPRDYDEIKNIIERRSCAYARSHQ